MKQKGEAIFPSYLMIRIKFMPKFVRFLQWVVLVLLCLMIGYAVILKGISLFNDPFVITTIVLGVLLELALYVIYKLIEID